MTAIAIPELWKPAAAREGAARFWTPINAGHVAVPGGHETQGGLFERILDHLRRPMTRQAEDAKDLITLMAGFSDAAEIDVLNSVHNKHGSINLYTTPFLALTTASVADTNTGSTITEANYTGYARIAISTGSLNTASAGAITTSTTLTYAACTAGTSTIIGWATCTASTVGQVIVYGTCTSTVISTTQTPATVNAGAYSVTLD